MNGGMSGGMNGGMNGGVHGVPVGFSFGFVVLTSEDSGKHATKEAVESLRKAPLTGANATCLICMESMLHGQTEKEGNEEPLEMPCGHTFGSLCLRKWLERSPTCPLCRVEIASASDNKAFVMPFFFVPAPGFTFVPGRPGAQEEQRQSPDADADEAESQSQARQAPQEPSASDTGAFPASRRPALRARHHPYTRPNEAAPAPPSTCDMAAVGLCCGSANLYTLECGHAYHQTCLQAACVARGDGVDDAQCARGTPVRCEMCGRFKRVLIP